MCGGLGIDSRLGCFVSLVYVAKAIKKSIVYMAMRLEYSHWLIAIGIGISISNIANFDTLVRTKQMIPANTFFGSYTFPFRPNCPLSQKTTDAKKKSNDINPDNPDIACCSSGSSIAPEDNGIGRFIHMDIGATDNCFWYYAVNRTGELLRESPYEVFRINLRTLPIVNEPEFCGYVQLDGLICANRLWLDRSGTSFYGLCLHPNAATAGSKEALESIFYYDSIRRSIGVEEGQICLMKIDRQTLQRVDLQFSEPIEIGKFDLTGSGPFCRLHFHFISDLEAILILDRCDFIEEHPAGYFTLHSVVYRLFLGNQKESQPIVTVSKIGFPDFLEEPSEYDKNLVKESRQIYVYITGNADERQQRQNSNTRTAKYFFYLVDLYQACHVLDDANWKWIKWKSDWSMIPSEKHFMCRHRFDTGIVLLNDVEGFYVKMQLVPSQQRCRFEQLFPLNVYPWISRTASVFSGYAKPNMLNNNQLRLILPPPFPLKYLAFWKLSEILDGEEPDGSGSNKRMSTKTTRSNITEFPRQGFLISTCKKAANLMHRNFL